MTADDCVRVSRSLARALEAEAQPGARYLVQASSPGFERPVRFVEHWRRYLGREVRVTARGLSGHPRATVVAVPDDDHVQLRLADGEPYLLALENLKEATLLMDSAS